MTFHQVIIVITKHRKHHCSHLFMSFLTNSDTLESSHFRRSTIYYLIRSSRQFIIMSQLDRCSLSQRQIQSSSILATLEHCRTPLSFLRDSKTSIESPECDRAPSLLAIHALRDVRRNSFLTDFVRSSALSCQGVVPTYPGLPEAPLLVFETL